MNGLLINILSKKYFDSILEKEEAHDNRLFFDLSCVYISEIQSLYLNPINYRLSQKKANRSIYLGLLSVALGVITIVVPNIIKNILLCKKNDLIHSTEVTKPLFKDSTFYQTEKMFLLDSDEPLSK